MPIVVTLKRSRYSTAGRGSMGARSAFYCRSHEKQFCRALLLCRPLVQRQFPLPAVHGLRRWGLQGRRRREGLPPPPVRRKGRRLRRPCTWPLYRRCLRGLHSPCYYGGGCDGRLGCAGGGGRRCPPLHPVRAPLPLLYRHNVTPPPRGPPPPPSLPQLPAAQAYPTREPAVAHAALEAAFPASP